MRSVFNSLLAVISTGFCSAQEMTPAVTNMAGFDATQGSSVVTISIGEPAVTTLTTPNAFVTQGFLQPEILPCLDVEFGYFPNPATDEITIEAYGCEIKIQSLQILNLWGQVLSTLLPRKDNKVLLDGLSQGVYIIQVYLTSGITKTIKIVKIAP
jgi:hypothetical protein